MQDNWTVGNFNAWVEAGTTKDERRERLASVPEEYRADVERHVKTVFAINSFHARKAKEKKKPRRQIAKQ